MNSPSRSNSKEGLWSTDTRVFLHAAHACSSRRIQSCSYYVSRFLCICSQAFLLLHGYGFCNAFGLVGEMFSAKQGRVDSSQLPPCADCYCCLTRTPWEQTTSCKQLFGEEVCRVALTVPSPVGFRARSCKLSNCTCLTNGLKCTDMCIFRDCNNRDLKQWRRPHQRRSLVKIVLCFIFEFRSCIDLFGAPSYLSQNLLKLNV